VGATPKQIQEYIMEAASSYESPEDVVKHYNENPQLKDQAYWVVIQDNLTEYALAHSKVTEHKLTLNELRAYAGYY
jgi:trigger factor